jgi:hypothetical protein
VVSVQELQSAAGIKAFPMPVQNGLTVQHNSASINSKIEIVSIDGRLIKSLSVADGSQQTNIDFSSAKAGVYIVRFVNNTNVESLKIVKQ